MTDMPHFTDIAEPKPTAAGLAVEYAGIGAMLDHGDRRTALAEWDGLRRRYDTWSALVHLRFAQDTTDTAARADRDYADALAPEAADLEVALKRRLLGDSDRTGLAALVGEHALRLWETDVTTFDPAIKGDLEEEARMASRYTELLASSKLTIAGQTVNLQIPPKSFFLPQRPYVPLGTLRHVITYPNAMDAFSQEEMVQVLRDVGLPQFCERLDHDDNWPLRLSMGEQQRLGFARALLAKPDWVFLDEATASVDPAAETELSGPEAAAAERHPGIHRAPAVRGGIP